MAKRRILVTVERELSRFCGNNFLTNLYCIVHEFTFQYLLVFRSKNAGESLLSSFRRATKLADRWSLSAYVIIRQDGINTNVNHITLDNISSLDTFSRIFRALVCNPVIKFLNRLYRTILLDFTMINCESCSFLRDAIK